MFARALTAVGAPIDEAGASCRRMCPARQGLYENMAKAKSQHRVCLVVHTESCDGPGASLNDN